MGIEYWDPAGVNILAYGGPYYFNGGYPPDSIYIWNGLTLFNNADTTGSSNQADPNYSELLTGIDAVGNKLDPTLKYKLVTPRGVLAVLPEFACGSPSARADPYACATFRHWNCVSSAPHFATCD